MIDLIIDITLLTFLAITAVAIVRLSNLFATVMLYGIFSLLSAGLFVIMDAPDVAFTEAVIGAEVLQDAEVNLLTSHRVALADCSVSVLVDPSLESRCVVSLRYARRQCCGKLAVKRNELLRYFR